jgi:serine phosphatase RsbU (regulator of sigma subunit)
MNTATCLQAFLEESEMSPQVIADDLLEQALKLDRGRPTDDISVVVIKVNSYQGDPVRRMTVRLPLSY